MAGAAARYVGAELRRLREQYGMSGDRAAQLLKWSPSKVSRYERARTGMRPGEVESLLRLYKTPEDKAAELVSIAEQVARRRGSPDGYRDPLADDLDDAKLLREWALLTFPRVLQTADYALRVLHSTQAVLQAMRTEITVSVQATVGWTVRTDETEKDRPLSVYAVFDESALYRQVGTPSVMRAQLGHLAEIAERGRVQVRMLPYIEASAALVPPFTYVAYAAPPGCEVADAVLLTAVHGVHLVEVEREVYHYGLLFEQLWRAALGENDTVEAVQRARKEHWA